EGSTMQKLERTTAVVAGLLAFAAGAAHAQPFAEAKSSRAGYSGGNLAAQQPCEKLAELKLPEVVQIAARAVAADPTAPAHCRVSGVIDSEVAFEVNLPAAWNGRFYMIGNGGLAGEGPDDPGRAAQRAAALVEGFAMASTNTGHDGRKGQPGTFVITNPKSAIDYAYRAVHVTAATAKEIANRYYAKPVAHAYWNSCSNGGRQGLLEAQRYPADFDGIVASAPWVDQTGFAIGALWNQRALTEAPISPEKIALVAQHVMAKCDEVDGLKDGLIDDPRQCKFDVAKEVPSCTPGSNGSMCLTASQAAAIQKVYDGPKSGGKPIFPGFMVGSEALAPAPNGPASGWMNLILSAQPGTKPADFALAEATMRYLVFDPPQPDYDFRKFDFDRDPPIVERWGKIANATDTNLTAFRARGGKLIMTYGWADPILQPLMGVNYYEKAVVANGPDGTEFLRLFMVPGMAHCGGGVGPDQNDAVTAVIDWVEKGVAPDKLIAKKIVNGTTTRSRPLCPYPQVARYKGQGSLADAASFECRMP
ncbi:MAG TPA: tannase/feruloyl esterase family alpha/beta hydrolase, partial [Gammaproteobacteria bacterium]|nr:tannase/feruloyl esterase family alpha/beta hydrolase [Gammaproteobacteria bacterium]